MPTGYKRRTLHCASSARNRSRIRAGHHQRTRCRYKCPRIKNSTEIPLLKRVRLGFVREHRSKPSCSGSLVFSVKASRASTRVVLTWGSLAEYLLECREVSNRSGSYLSRGHCSVMGCGIRWLKRVFFPFSPLCHDSLYLRGGLSFAFDLRNPHLRIGIRCRVRRLHAVRHSAHAMSDLLPQKRTPMTLSTWTGLMSRKVLRRSGYRKHGASTSMRFISSIVMNGETALLRKSMRSSFAFDVFVFSAKFPVTSTRSCPPRCTNAPSRLASESSAWQTKSPAWSAYR